MIETIRQLAGSDVDTIAARIADLASPATDRNERGEMTGGKRAALLVLLALLSGEMYMSTRAIGKYTTK